MRAARAEFGAQSVAKREVLEIEPEIDGKPPTAGPGEVRASRDRAVAVAAMRDQIQPELSHLIRGLQARCAADRLLRHSPRRALADIPVHADSPWQQTSLLDIPRFVKKVFTSVKAALTAATGTAADFYSGTVVTSGRNAEMTQANFVLSGLVGRLPILQ